MASIACLVVEILKKPTLGDMAVEIALLAAPIWVAVAVGVLVGWAWRPRWAEGLVGEKKTDCSIGPCLPGFNLAQDLRAECCASSSADEKLGFVRYEQESDNVVVNTEDLKHLRQLVEERDGGRLWHQLMDKSLPNMSYQAWRRDPENGPPQYRTRTVFEDATPETVRDFFWDDEFRVKNKWDDMLLHHSTLQECPKTGTMIVHWIRKFPFFCSDREYIIGRRIWESERTFYCVTKGVPNDSVPRKNKPRRVDLFYSSWCIRRVESIRGDGQQTACEVLLFHHEDMGIPWEIAKLGVRQGMWGTVQKIEPGLRAYQRHRSSGEPPSRSAIMAEVNTRLTADELGSYFNSPGISAVSDEASKKQSGNNFPRLLLIGGAVVLACSLDRGLLTKAVIFGAARRLANLGKKM